MQHNHFTGQPGLRCGLYVRFARSGNTPAGRERAAPWGRVYASLMTNGRLHTVTTLSVLAAHAATITRWQRDLSSTNATRQQRAAEEMQSCISTAPWAERRRTAVRMAAAEGRFDRLAHLVDLHRIQLTYVTNKKGGDQILSALETEVREIHAVMGDDYRLDGFAMELISGGNRHRGHPVRHQARRGTVRPNERGHLEDAARYRSYVRHLARRGR